jgi:putative ATP-binding cassette transporter
LSDSEKERLSVARVILQKPQWVILNGAIAGFDRETRQRIEKIFTRDLADIGVVNIGRDMNISGFFTRTLHLSLNPEGPSFTPAIGGAAEDREGRPAPIAAH